MDAEERADLLSAYADGELDEDELALVQELLESDRDAAYDSTQVLNMKNILRRWDGVNASGGFAGRVLEQAGKKPSRGGGGGGTRFLLGLACAAFLLAVSVFVLLLVKGPDWLAATGREMLAIVVDGDSPKDTGPAPVPPPSVRPAPPPRTERPGSTVNVVGVRPDGTGADATWSNVSTLRGIVMVTKPGGEIMPARSGTPLGREHALRTGDGAMVELTIPPDGRFRMRESSSVRLRGKRLQIELREGSLLVHWTAAAGARGRLEILAGEARVEVPTGTARVLVTRLADDTVHVSVAAGQATVFTTPDGPLNVGAGRRVTVDAQGRHSRPRVYADGDADFSGFGPD